MKAAPLEDGRQRVIVAMRAVAAAEPMHRQPGWGAITAGIMVLGLAWFKLGVQVPEWWMLESLRMNGRLADAAATRGVVRATRLDDGVYAPVYALELVYADSSTRRSYTRDVRVSPRQYWAAGGDTLSSQGFDDGNATVHVLVAPNDPSRFGTADLAFLRALRISALGILPLLTAIGAGLLAWGIRGRRVRSIPG